MKSRICPACGEAFSASLQKGRIQTCCSLLCRSRWKIDNGPSVEERFWAKAAKCGPNACWLWMGSKNSNGYGNFRFEGRTRVSHRVAYILTHGSIPSSMSVCHRCDTPACVNPNHLFLGTTRDNILDMMSKGRARHSRVSRNPGEANGQAKLTAADVREIVRLWKSGMTQKRIADHFTVQPGQVSRIVLGIEWAATTGIVYTPGRGKRMFTDEQIHEIVRLCRSGIVQTEVARQFNCQKSVVHSIVRGRSCSSITGIQRAHEDGRKC